MDYATECPYLFTKGSVQEIGSVKDFVEELAKVVEAGKQFIDPIFCFDLMAMRAGKLKPITDEICEGPLIRSPIEGTFENSPIKIYGFGYRENIRLKMKRFILHKTTCRDIRELMASIPIPGMRLLSSATRMWMSLQALSMYARNRFVIPACYLDEGVYSRLSGKPDFVERTASIAEDTVELKRCKGDALPIKFTEDPYFLTAARDTRFRDAIVEESLLEYLHELNDNGGMSSIGLLAAVEWWFETEKVDAKLSINQMPILAAKVADSKVADSKVADSKVADSKVADSKVADSKVADSKVADSKVATGQVSMEQSSPVSLPVAVKEVTLRESDESDDVMPELEPAPGFPRADHTVVGLRVFGSTGFLQITGVPINRLQSEKLSHTMLETALTIYPLIGNRVMFAIYMGAIREFNPSPYVLETAVKQYAALSVESCPSFSGYLKVVTEWPHSNANDSKLLWTVLENYQKIAETNKDLGCIDYVEMMKRMMWE